MNSIKDVCSAVELQIADVFLTHASFKGAMTFLSFCLCSVAKIPVVVLAVPIVILLDWSIRFFYAWRTHDLDEEVGQITFTKVIAYAIVICSGYLLDQVFGSIAGVMAPFASEIFSSHFAITQTICTFIVVNDAIRIFETGGKLGVPFPIFILRRLRKTRDIINLGKHKGKKIQF